VKDDVLAAEKDGIWWVLVSGKVKGNGIATDTEGHVVPILRTQADVTAQAVAGTRFVMSGVPFHAYESSSGAQAEFSVIGTVSTVMHCLIVILAFWTLAPLVLTLGSMAMGVLAGLSATFIAFGEVHIFTLVFGTTLIGVSIDYALYYFAEWLNPWAPGDGRSVIKRILPGISLGLVTSVISFLVLCFVPFPLLRQMAIFSTVGLLSTYLSVLLIFPRFKPPKRLAGRLDISRNRPVRMAEALMGLYRRFFALPAWTRWASLALLAAVTVLGLTRVDMDNNLRSIYKVSPAMAANEKEAAEILQHGSTGMYFIVKGATPEETRQREEALTARLASGTAEKKLKSWLGLTLLLPSERRQDRTWQAAGKTLMPAIDEQMRLLDFDQTAAEAVRGDWKAQEGRHIDPEAFAQLPFAGMVGSLWIGEVDSHWFSAVMLMGVQDKAFIRGLEKEVEGVYLINKAEDIANVLQDLSQAALLIVAGAYLLIFLGLWWIYDLRSAIRISLVPAAASIMTAAILGFTGLPFNLFAIVGLILVPGIGIDYAIFYKEGSSASSVTMLAIFLTMLSNIMSFGLLGFSSLAAVFGVTVTLGVAISFLLAPLTLPRDVPRGDAQAH
jgi:predicted exporter